MVRAWLRGDWGAAREACVRQARLAPGSIPHFQVAEEARRLNRPQEALDILSQIEPERGEMREWIFYWVELAHVHHRLGDHQQELEVAQRARTLYPDHPTALLLELRALAALGRFENVYRRLDQSAASPRTAAPRPGSLMREAALELRAHGQPEPAQELFERSLDWYLHRPPQEQLTPSHRRDLARAHYYAGRWEEAQALFADLVSEGESPSFASHHGHLQGYLDLGYLGVLAVRLRDREAEEQITKELATLPQPYLFGSNTYWRAAMAALKGEKEQAVALLRQAFAEGLPREIFIHTDIHFEALRTHPLFEELMLPKG
jgi:tetratricopeptide (TPR) repeat protein